MKKKRLYGMILALLTFLSCGQHQSPQNNEKEVDTLSKEALLKHVKLAINPRFQDWVLFQNGTYIIFDSIDIDTDMEAEAVALMKQYGPVYAGGEAGDFAVTYLNQTEGWIVSGHGYGMYTYVNPNELSSISPSEVEIGLFGRSKRDDDGQQPVVLHVNRKATP